VLEYNQRKVNQSSDTVAIFRAQGVVELINEILDVPEMLRQAIVRQQGQERQQKGAQ
jgi:hypothetical protein